MTRRALLKVIAFAAWFLLILNWSSGNPWDVRSTALQRVAVTAVLSSGLIVATAGIIELFAWNGKILWVFQPYDWLGQSPGALARTSGPFVNPDHFGDYLAMALPVAVGGAIFDFGLFSIRFTTGFRLLCATSAFVLTAGLLLSGSRGAYIGATCGLAIVMLLSGRMSNDTLSAVLHSVPRKLVCAGLMAGAIIALALVFVGPIGRADVYNRLHGDTLADGTRLQLAGDSLRMLRDYPTFGVGLAAWPEMFPKYRTPPWSANFFREAHNDYVQILAETGLAGFTIVCWLIVSAAKLIRPSFKEGSRAVSPLLIVICGSLAAFALHEFVDFNFQTPANGLLASLLFALAVRLASTGGSVVRVENRVRIYATCIIAVATILIVCAISQNKIPYPYNDHLPTTPAEVVEAIRTHPAESAPHVALSMLLNHGTSARLRVNELRTAAWLDPFNPHVNDYYAIALLKSGDRVWGLKELTQSVEYSPALDTHPFLRQRYIHRLTADEASAIEDGFIWARARGYDGAAIGLAQYYSARGRYDDAAAGFLYAARRELEPSSKLSDLLNGGTAYAAGHRLDDAAAVFRRAIALDPSDSDAYNRLIRLVLAPRQQLKAASALVAQGIQSGANPESLFETLADAAAAAQNLTLAERAFSTAISVRPQYSTLFQLGQVYIDDRQYDRAVAVLRRAIDKRPDSSEAHFYLGLAEEDNYNFADAEQDFSRAIALDPENTNYRDYYRQFKQRLIENIRTLNPPP